MIIKLFIVLLVLIWAGAVIAYGVRLITAQINAKKKTEYEKRHAAWLKAEEEEQKRQEARRNLLQKAARSSVKKGRQTF